jgi:hypothetical protein
MTYTPRRSKDQWQTTVDDFQQCGLTIKSFCKQRNISYASFIKWKRQLTPSMKKSASALIKVTGSTMKSEPRITPKIAFHLPSGGSITWDETVDPSYIAVVLRSLS